MERSTKEVLKEIRGKVDYDIDNIKVREGIIKEIYKEYGDFLTDRFNYYNTGTLKRKDDADTLTELKNLMSSMSNYILFCNGVERDSKYPYRKDDSPENIRSRESVSLESYMSDISIEEKSMIYKHYDDQNSGKFKISDFGERLHECPYVKDYIDFELYVRPLIEEFDKNMRHFKERVNELKKANRHNEAEKLMKNNTYSEKVEKTYKRKRLKPIDQRFNVDVELEYEDVETVDEKYIGFELSDGKIYTEYRIGKLKRSIGFMANNCMELDKDIIYILRTYYGYFYFNSPLRSTTQPDWHLTSFTSKDFISELLRYSGGKLSTWKGSISYDFNNLLKEVKFSYIEKRVLDLYKDIDITQEEIGERLKISKQNVNKAIDRVCSKIIKQYKREYEDWLYYGAGYVKGDFKKCNRCKNVKLKNEKNFRKRSNGNLYNQCRDCEKS